MLYFTGSSLYSPSIALSLALMLEFSAALAHWSILRILFSRSSCIIKMRTSLQFGAGLVVAGTMMDGLRLPFVQL